MDLVSFHSFWTVLTVLAFFLLVVWAWSGRQKHDFDEAAQIPLQDYPVVTADTSADETTREENKHE